MSDIHTGRVFFDLHTHAYTSAVNWTLAFHSEHLLIMLYRRHFSFVSTQLLLQPPRSPTLSHPTVLHGQHLCAVSRSSLLAPVGVNAVMLNEMHWSRPDLRCGCGAEEQGKKHQLLPTRSTAGSTFMNYSHRVYFCNLLTYICNRKPLKWQRGTKCLQSPAREKKLNKILNI